jgi:hypothetical protein
MQQQDRERRDTWLYLMPLFERAKDLLDPKSPDFVRDIEDLASFVLGHRLLDALPLVVPWLKRKRVQLVERLGGGAYGHAFLTSAGTVVKITWQRAEFVAAQRLEGLSVPNVVHVYDTAALGFDPHKQWEYFALELELLAPTGWPPGRNVPADAVEQIRRGCANYERITGYRCDRHNENFGLNAAGEWTLLDLGPITR